MAARRCTACPSHHIHRRELDNHSRRRPRRYAWWWTTVYAGAGGLAALLWLLLRSGPKPSRLGYPCQQAALGTAGAAFAAPIAALAGPVLRGLGRALRKSQGRVAAGVLAGVAVALLAFASGERDIDTASLRPSSTYRPDVYLVNKARGITTGRYGGVDDLITLMGVSGFKWHRSEQIDLTSGPDGLIGISDVVILKINGQWERRGGTNTDVLRGVIRRIVEHPDGFVGEVIVADNEQFASGALNWGENNAQDYSQSAQVVVDDFAAEGWKVATSLWKTIREISVQEYSSGDMTSGYVVDPVRNPQTQINVSYPKFQTAFGTYVSYKYGIWYPTSQTYAPERLVVINMPVLKTHGQYAITASVKNHMGLVTTGRIDTNAHSAVASGGMGTVLAEVRMPDLTILDCIWILARPRAGPSAPYESASRRDQLLAGTDPIALDMWAAKHILIPQIIANGYSYDAYHWTQDPDNPDSVFRRYIDASMSELLAAGIAVTNDVSAVRLHVWVGDLDRDGDVDAGDFIQVASCGLGPGVEVGGTGCEDTDFDDDGDADLGDFAAFQQMFTGAR